MSNLIRRAIIAFALIAGIAPAIAQVPPPVPALPDTERRTSYQISASTCACNVNFAIYGDSTDYGDWIEVFVNGVLIPSSEYTITSPTGPLGNIPRPITDAVLTFNLLETGTVQIVGARRPRRVSQFSENAGVSARNLNLVLSDIIAQNRETWDKINDVTGRVVRAPPGETLSTLPPVASRASMGACFDSGGNLAPCLAVPSGSFAVGSGIKFTGTGPTTIATDPSIVPTLVGRNVFSPSLADSGGNSSIGIFLTPSVAAGTTNNSFLTPYNMEWGTPTAPVPAGTLGSLDGYECNQSTNQTLSDAAGAQGNHCFGATIALHGGVQSQGIAITATMDTVAGVYFGSDLNLENNVAGGQMTGYFVSSLGSQAASAGFRLFGSFVNGIVLGNNNIVGTSYQTFTNGPLASLPTCGVQVSSGTIAMINDASTNAWGVTPSGGGVGLVLVFCNGVNWTVAAK